MKKVLGFFSLFSPFVFLFYFVFLFLCQRSKAKKRSVIWEERTKETEKLLLLDVDSLQIVMVDKEMISTLLSKWLCKVWPEFPHLDLQSKGEAPWKRQDQTIHTLMYPKAIPRSEFTLDLLTVVSFKHINQETPTYLVSKQKQWKVSFPTLQIRKLIKIT